MSICHVNKQEISIRKLVLFFLLFFSLFSLLTSCTNKNPRKKVYYTYFDTVCEIIDYSGDSENEFDRTCEEVERILEDYHRHFDIYHDFSELNNLKTLNENVGQKVHFDDTVLDFLEYCVQCYAMTDGETNVMMGAVTQLWRKCLAEGRIPTSEELQEAEKHTKIDNLEINRADSTATIKDMQALIDVGAIGKGYAVQKAGEYLESIGKNGYVLNCGGNIKMIGSKPDGTGWKTAIKNPFNSDEYAQVFDLNNVSCVTSGIYERYVTVGGKNYHHIIDKDTLFPSEYFASVTVITKDSSLADALSTALSCMSIEEGLQLLDLLEDDIKVLWIKPDGEMLFSEALN